MPVHLLLLQSPRSSRSSEPWVYHLSCALPHPCLPPRLEQPVTLHITLPKLPQDTQSARGCQLDPDTRMPQGWELRNKRDPSLKGSSVRLPLLPRCVSFLFHGHPSSCVCLFLSVFTKRGAFHQSCLDHTCQRAVRKAISHRMHKWSKMEMTAH